MRRLAHVRSSGRGPVSVIRYFRSRFVISRYLCSLNPAETRPWADSEKYSCWRAGIPGVGRVVGLICHVAATLRCDFVLSLFFYSILFRFVFYFLYVVLWLYRQDCIVFGKAREEAIPDLDKRARSPTCLVHAYSIHQRTDTVVSSIEYLYTEFIKDSTR